MDLVHVAVVRAPSAARASPVRRAGLAASAAAQV